MSNVEAKDTRIIHNSKTDLKTWLKTMRVQTALVTCLALWMGYITVDPLNIQSAAFLGVIGILYHIHGFTLNEVKDRQYDSAIGNGSVHPISRGEVSYVRATFIAWGAYIACILVSIIMSITAGYSMIATMVLIASLVPAYMYNKYSKSHWWSNIYLSTWAAIMVLVGGLHAGTLNWVTYAIAIAVAIQMFVQVVEGDLKDLTGNEKSVCRRLGVKIVSPEEYLKGKVPVSAEELSDVYYEIVTYTKKFIILVYSVKSLQLSLLILIIYSTIGFHAPMVFWIVYYSLIIVFITSLSMIMVYVYERDKIKKFSSIHEISSIFIFGSTMYAIDPRSGLFVGVAPVIWYILVNSFIHSGALNPDV